MLKLSTCQCLFVTSLAWGGGLVLGVMEMPAPECGGESGRSSPSPAASPEFEFWMVGKNPSSFPSPSLLTADELFSDGIVLPLQTLQISAPSGAGVGGDADGDNDNDNSSVLPEVAGEVAQPLAECGPAPTPDLPAVTFKWKDIFKAAGGGEPKERKKLERRVSSIGGNAELININIWPFSRSRSAGHSAAAAAGVVVSWTKARANASAAATTASSAPSAPSGRKVSSAPCSRSNSRGESSGPAIAAAAAPAAVPAGPLPSSSMLRRWVPGQGRSGPGAGIRLGRASPVWQLRRNKLQQTAEQKQNGNAGDKKKPTSAADADSTDNAANVNANAAVPCRNNAGCGGDGAAEEGTPPQGLFGLRTFFSKKVY